MSNHFSNKIISGYETEPDGGTNGIDKIGPDINAPNRYRLTPVQVALSAGNIEELKIILSNPNCDPMKPCHTIRGQVPTLSFINVNPESPHNKGLFQEQINEKAKIMRDLVLAAANCKKDLSVLREQQILAPEP